MGTSLQGKKIKDTYKSLVKVTDSSEAGSTGKQLSDGNGNDLGIYVDTDGVLGVGAAASVAIDAGSKTDAIIVPNGTDAEQPSGSSGMIRYNTTNTKMEYYDTAWKSFAEGDIDSVVAGDGLTGGASDGDATVNVVGGDGITVTADEVEVAVDDTTIELSASDGTGTVRIKDNAVTQDKLGAEFTSKAIIPSDYDIDFSTAAVFEDTMDADIDYDIENPKVGDVKTLVLTGDGTDRTISFLMSSSTGETFNKMKGSDSFSFTSGDKNLVQIICVSDTANSEVFWYSNSIVAS